MKLLSFYNHNKKEIQRYFVAYQKQGNDKSGNMIYIVNIWNNNLHNMNFLTDHRLDKYDNIKMQSCNIESDLQYMIDNL